MFASKGTEEISKIDALFAPVRKFELEITTQMVSEQRVIQSVAADYYCLSRKFSCLCKNFIVSDFRLSAENVRTLLFRRNFIV